MHQIGFSLRLVRRRQVTSIGLFMIEAYIFRVLASYTLLWHVSFKLYKQCDVMIYSFLGCLLAALFLREESRGKRNNELESLLHHEWGDLCGIVIVKIKY